MRIARPPRPAGIYSPVARKGEELVAEDPGVTERDAEPLPVPGTEVRGTSLCATLKCEFRR